MIINIIALIIICLSWFVFKNQAIELSIQRSESKYKVFGWFNDIFRSNNYFKSTINRDYALNKSYHLIDDYITKRKNYWKISLGQLSLLTFLYVALAIALFVVGSILVIKGQLSLGQLIAAEILYNIALFGSSKLSDYFNIYYRLIAASVELNNLFILPSEKIINNKTPLIKENTAENILTLDNLMYHDNSGGIFNFNFKIKQCTSNLIITSNAEKRNILVELISNILEPKSGEIKFYNYRFSDFNAQDLRNHLYVIDNAEIFSCTIYEYLTHGDNNMSENEINNILEIMSLKKLVYNFPEILQTNLCRLRAREIVS